MNSNLIIAMWSGPRNLSTALMRSFGNRRDVSVVLDEPFYASYLLATNKNHPLRNDVINSQLNSIVDVKQLCQKKSNGITFQKHMTHHILDKDLSWINSLTNCFLIRNPIFVVKSFFKSWDKGNFEDIGFSQQYSIFKYVQGNVNSRPIVIDASKLRNNPKKVLQAVCNILDISWDENMLKWEKGIKEYDGIWAKHWYPSVMNSDSFAKEEHKTLKLSPNDELIVDKAMPIYEELLKFSV